MTYTPKKNYRSFRQLRPFYMPGAIEQLTNGVHTIELYKLKYSINPAYEIRFERPNGNTGWGYVLSDGTLSAVDLGTTTPNYVKERAIRMWHDMEAVMRDGS